MHDQLGVHELDGVDCLTRDELNGGLGELAILVDVFVERLAGYVLHDERADLAAAAAELELDTKQAHYVRMIQVEESLEFAAKQHVGLLHELVVAQHELASVHGANPSGHGRGRHGVAQLLRFAVQLVEILQIDGYLTVRDEQTLACGQYLKNVIERVASAE